MIFLGPPPPPPGYVCFDTTRCCSSFGRVQAADLLVISAEASWGAARLSITVTSSLSSSASVGWQSTVTTERATFRIDTRSMGPCDTWTIWWSASAGSEVCIMALCIQPRRTAAERCDFNRDGMVNSQDFFDFLAAFLEFAPAADFNSDGVVNSQDFLGMTGCIQ